MATKRKKPRSAAQKAATRKLVALNKRNARKTVLPKRRKRTITKRKAAKRKVLKQKKRKGNVAKKKGLLDNIPLIKSKMFKQAAVGVGTATLGGAILGLVVPQLASQPLVKPVLALAGGGAIGAVAQILTQGGLSGLGLGNLTGGGGNAMTNTINTGFA